MWYSFFTKTDWIHSNKIFRSAVRRHEGVSRRGRTHSRLPAEHEHEPHEPDRPSIRTAHVWRRTNDPVHESIDIDRPGMGAAHERCQPLHSPHHDWNWCNSHNCWWKEYLFETNWCLSTSSPHSALLPPIPHCSTPFSVQLAITSAHRRAQLCRC